MKNTDMKESRFLRWHRARQLHRRIMEHIAAGGRVVIGTYTAAKLYRDPSHFVCNRGGLYVRRGKAFDQLTGFDGRLLVGIRFTR